MEGGKDEERKRKVVCNSVSLNSTQLLSWKVHSRFPWTDPPLDWPNTPNQQQDQTNIHWQLQALLLFTHIEIAANNRWEIIKTKRCLSQIRLADCFFSSKCLRCEKAKRCGNVRFTRSSLGRAFPTQWAMLHSGGWIQMSGPNYFYSIYTYVTL